PSAPSYAVKTLLMEDGSYETNTHAPCGLREWTIEYGGISDEQAQILDDHFNAARNAHEFLFYDAQAGRLYDHVQYKRFQVVKHKKSWQLGRQIELVRYP